MSKSLDKNLQQLSAEAEKAKKERSVKIKQLLSENKPENKFPVEAFPEKVQGIIKAWNEAHRFPIDYYGLGILTVASAVIGNAYGAQYEDTWQCSPLLYSIIVGHSGIGKSKILDHVMAPIYDIERKLHSEYLTEIEQWEQEKFEARNQKLKTEEPPEPPRKRIRLNKATMEALNLIMQNNPRGCLLIREELIGWIKSMNQYRAGDDGETWLEIWDNKFITVDRKDYTIAIERAFMSVIGGIQPAIIQSLAADNRDSNGAIPRFLFAYPEQLEKPMPSKVKADKSVYDSWKKIIDYIHNLPNDIHRPANKYETSVVNTFYIPLDDKASDLFFQFRCDNTNLQNDTEDELLKAIYAKHDTYVLRFTIILFLLDRACRNVPTEYNDISSLRIGRRFVENAITITEYFRSTSKKVCQNFGPSANKHLGNKEQLIWYKSLPDDQFTNKDAQELGKELKIGESTINRRLANKDLFRRLGKFYEKISYVE